MGRAKSAAETSDSRSCQVGGEAADYDLTQELQLSVKEVAAARQDRHRQILRAGPVHHRRQWDVSSTSP